MGNIWVTEIAWSSRHGVPRPETYESDNLVEPDTFDELMVELYNLHLQDIPDDDPRWQQFKRLMQISLRRPKQEKS